MPNSHRSSTRAAHRRSCWRWRNMDVGKLRSADQVWRSNSLAHLRRIKAMNVCGASIRCGTKDHFRFRRLSGLIRTPIRCNAMPVGTPIRARAPCRRPDQADLPCLEGSALHRRDGRTCRPALIQRQVQKPVADGFVNGRDKKQGVGFIAVSAPPGPQRAWPSVPVRGSSSRIRWPK